MAVWCLSLHGSLMRSLRCSCAMQPLRRRLVLQSPKMVPPSQTAATLTSTFKLKMSVHLHLPIAELPWLASNPHIAGLLSNTDFFGPH